MPQGMVDIHSHILYGLDDGPQDFETSVKMLQIAAGSGTADIVATPHADLQYPFRPDEIEKRITELSAAVPFIRIHRGCDFHLHFDSIRDCLANPQKYTINHKRYLLVEFADEMIAKNTAEMFDRMERMDITPIVTHPERNMLLMKQVDRMAQWVRAGCLIQVTGQSFLGTFGKHAQAAATQLMSLNMVHFVASDAHDPDYRPPSLQPAYEHLSQQYSEEIARRLCITHPAVTLTGEYLELEDPEPSEKSKKWYQLW